jgi:putative flippase GtrA
MAPPRAAPPGGDRARLLVHRVGEPASGFRTRVRNFVSIVLSQNSRIGVPGRALRHLIVGGIATLLYMGLVSLQVELFKLHPVLATCMAFLLMEIFLYLINRLWVYQSTGGHGAAIARYLVVIAVALGLNSGIMALTVDVLGLWYVWGLIGTTLILPPTNFLLNFYWAFRSTTLNSPRCRSNHDL